MRASHFKILVEDSNRLTVHLPLDRDIYLLFNSDIVKFVWGTDEREGGELSREI